MKHIFTVLCLLMVSQFSLAVDCPPAKVKQIQPEANGKILVHIDHYSWRNLGHVDSPGVKEMFAVVLAAWASDRKISMRYPGSYDCSQYNTVTPAQMIRTH